jgi:hypothetical protein
MLDGKGLLLDLGRTVFFKHPGGPWGSSKGDMGRMDCECTGIRICSAWVGHRKFQYLAEDQPSLGDTMAF